MKSAVPSPVPSDPSPLRRAIAEARIELRRAEAAAEITKAQLKKSKKAHKQAKKAAKRARKGLKKLLAERRATLPPPAAKSRPAVKKLVLRKSKAPAPAVPVTVTVPETALKPAAPDNLVPPPAADAASA